MKKKLLATTIATVAAMAVTASAAQALTVVSGVGGVACPAVSASGATVTGGCLIEDVAGPFALYANGVQVQSGNMQFDIRVGADAMFYAVDQVATGQGLTMVPCKNSSGAVLPWPRVDSPIPGSHAIAACLANYQSPTQPFIQQTVPVALGFDANYFFTGMTQLDSPTLGIRNAAWSNTGATNEIRVEL